MKTPRPGPTIEDLLDEHGFEVIGRVVNSDIGPTVQGRYRHWDSLRHMDPPGELTAEQWWLGIQSARNQVAQATGYRDAEGAAFRLSLTPEAHRMLHRIDREASGRIEMPGLIGSTTVRKRFLVASLQEEAITSSMLEGANTTRKAAKELLRTGREPIDRSERMVVNTYDGMRFVSEHQHDDITPERVLELHRIVTSGTLDDPDDAGRLQRPGEERVGVYDEQGRLLHRPPPADQLPERFSDLCAYANGDADPGTFVHPVVRAVLSHFRVGVDHPFVDGNGRVARALFYWVMLREGYWLTEYLTVSRLLREAPARYVRSYLYSEDDNDATYFVLHQLGIVERAIDELRAWLGRKLEEVRASEAAARSVELNPRQRALLSHALRNAEASYTHHSHATSHDVTIQTASVDLGDLVVKGLLGRRRVGRRFVYSAPADLRQRLAEG